LRINLNFKNSEFAVNRKMTTRQTQQAQSTRSQFAPFFTLVHFIHLLVLLLLVLVVLVVVENRWYCIYVAHLHIHELDGRRLYPFYSRYLKKAEAWIPFPTMTRRRQQQQQ
jgi:hypothetical protein